MPKCHPYCHMHCGTHTVGGKGDEISNFLKFFFFQWRETAFICALFSWNSTTFLLFSHLPSSLAACCELPAQILTPILQDQVPQLEKASPGLWERQTLELLRITVRSQAQLNSAVVIPHLQKTVAILSRRLQRRAMKKICSGKDALLPPILFKALVPLKNKQGCCKSPGEGAGLAL